MHRIKAIFQKSGRGFSAAGLFALMLTLALSSLLFSCSREKSEQGGEGANPAELRYGLNTEPVTLDPLNISNTADGRSILFNVYEGLVKPDPAGGLVPAVAESWKIEQNGLFYDFTLKEGILFHDGTPLSPADVVFSLDTAVNAGFAGLGNIEKTEAISSREVRVTLKEPDPEFLPYLTIAIVPAANQDRERNPIGTGPFAIENYAPQQSMTLVKNQNYRQEGIPFLDKVTVVFSADSDALLTGLMGGNIEGASVTGSQLPQLEAGNFDIIPWNSNTVQLMALNNAREPFDDPRVRRALNHAVNIPEIIETAFYGRGEPSGSPLIPGLKNVYNETLRNPYPHNTERAKSLLAEAGFPNGFSLEITVPSNYTMHIDTAQVIINQLAAAGISGTIRLVDWTTWLSDVYRGRNFQATVISLDAANISPRSFLARYRSGESGNFLGFNNSDYDRVYNAALIEPDEEKRRLLYIECQKIISENAAAVYIQDIIGFRAFAGGKFDGIVNYPLYVIDFSTIRAVR